MDEHADSEEVPVDTSDWPVWGKGAVEAMRTVPSLARAAKACGVHRVTLHRRIQHSESFALAIDQARQEALDTLEETIVLRARTGQPIRKTVVKNLPDGTSETTTTEEQHISDTLAMFYLKRWRPEYRENYRIEHTGANGGPIRIDQERVDADIRTLLGELGS
jgi:hypothetical protein